MTLPEIFQNASSPTKITVGTMLTWSIPAQRLTTATPSVKATQGAWLSLTTMPLSGASRSTDVWLRPPIYQETTVAKNLVMVGF